MVCGESGSGAGAKRKDVILRLPAEKRLTLQTVYDIFKPSINMYGGYSVANTFDEILRKAVDLSYDEKVSGDPEKTRS